MFLQTDPTIAPPNVVWTIAGICIAMSLFSQWFSKRFSVSREQQMETQRRTQELQARMKEARGDQEAMMRMNQEMMELMKGMYKTQLIPMLIRSVIWFGLWGLLNLFFGDYDEYLPFNFVMGRKLFSLYIFVSLCFSVVLVGGKMIARKLNPEKHAKQEVIVDHINALDTKIMYASENPQNHPPQQEYTSSSSYFEEPPKKDWKKRLDE
ncbi:EMC3/TMCO1 family protein [Candidatus Lokiarchaeum ossiferum]|uniref:EMC3/TMCO1 family protein n=1 Tax=Candidatus Lokiarchaeum ossiferum TaxID=2951803 RepID=UPI00352F0298